MDFGHIGIIFYDPKEKGLRISRDIMAHENLILEAYVKDVRSLVAAEAKAKPPLIGCLYIPDGMPVLQELVTYIKETSLKTLVICESPVTGFEMLKLGANEMVVDVNGRSAFLVKSIHLRCRKMLEESQKARSVKLDRSGSPIKKVVAIGASTGGTDILADIVSRFPADMPPVLIVQHMPAVFTNLFAKRLNSLSRMTVLEAREGDFLQNGLVLLAPGDRQMVLERSAGRLRVSCVDTGLVSGHCPSVDALFTSVAHVQGMNAVGCILTGMGADGARGLLYMHHAGAYTIGQNKASCVVYGMPKAAWDMGAVSKQLPSHEIADHIISVAYP